MKQTESTGITLDNTERGRLARSACFQRWEGQTAEWKLGWDERDYEISARAEHYSYS